MKASIRSATATPRRRPAPRDDERRLVTQHPRRRVLSFAAGAAALPAISRMARAQVYPTHRVRIIVGFPAGGAWDITARLIGQWLSERLRQPFIIENRPGASGNIGTEAVVRAPPDGYTLLLFGTTDFINATFYDNLRFNIIRDISPVAGLLRMPLVMEVNPSVPAKTLPEFIAYAKANPGRINIGSAGAGGPIHLTGELFKMMAGIDMRHVPYLGSAPMLADLMGGQIQVAFDALLSSIEYIRAGNLRPLAVTTAAPWDALPHVPTVADYIPGFEASAVNAIGVPAKTPMEIIEKLNREINAGLATPKLKARFAELGGMVIPSSVAELRKLTVEDTEKWANVVRFSGAKPE
jgi:tripartite-type tricarboxylate transporter receptor subunit TctC